ncbi:4a-hydroxytetrahydrobiopterin dehydratase [bacterium]|nr:4a-hydroxytetrahydrobiopterin dehydratase [bacterium]
MTSKKLSDGSITQELKGLPGWSLAGDVLERTFSFTDFMEAFSFMTEMAMVSEQLHHHPEWTNVYKTLTIRLSTHDIGGISEKDIEWATRCNQRFNQSM